MIDGRVVWMAWLGGRGFEGWVPGDDSGLGILSEGVLKV